MPEVWGPPIAGAPWTRRVRGVVSVPAAAAAPTINNLNQALVAWWDLADANFLDSSGNGHTLQVGSGSCSLASGVNGSPAIQSNSGGYLRLAAEAPLITSTPYSFACWIYSTGITTGIWQGNPASVDNQILGNITTATFWRVNPTSNLSGTPISSVSWFHLVGTCDGTTSKVYCNGLLANSGTFPAVSFTSSTAFRLLFRRAPSGTTTGSRIQRTGVWSRVLNPSEVATLYNNGLGQSFPFYPQQASPEVRFGPPLRGAPWVQVLPIAPAEPVPFPTVPPAPAPSSTALIKPFVAPVLSDDQRLRHFTQVISSMLNSLVGQGILKQTGPFSWAIAGGAGGVLTWNGRGGAVAMTAADVQGAFGSVGANLIFGGPTPSFRPMVTEDLPLSPVTAGGYTNASIIVDNHGRITFAASGAVAGTVTSVSVVTANGVSGSVSNPTTTPAITLTLGSITPTSVAASGTVSGSNLSGTNTGDQTITLTGNVTGSGTGSFATTIAAGVVTNSMLAGATDVTHGGTGLATLTAHAVMLGEGTSNVAFATIGTAGRLLIDQGAGADPGFKALSADATITSAGALTIANSAVTLAKIANAAASSKLLGSGASGSGAAYVELTLGTNLSMSGTTLNAAGGGGGSMSIGGAISGGASTATLLYIDASNTLRAVSGATTDGHDTTFTSASGGYTAELANTTFAGQFAGGGGGSATLSNNSYAIQVSNTGSCFLSNVLTVSSGTNIGFFGVATVGQQSTSGTGASGFTQNASANDVFAESTFDGGLGGNAYTISDIVLALKKYGLLA